MRSLQRFLIVFIPALIVLFLPFTQDLGYPAEGVVALFAGMVANLVYWFWYGGKFAYDEFSSGKRFRKAFRSSEAGRFALAVFGVFFWFSLFCIINAAGRMLNL